MPDGAGVRAIDEITNEVLDGEVSPLTNLQRLGYRIFKLLLLLLVIFELVLFALYGFWAYPRLDDVVTTVTGSDADPGQAWIDARSAWVQSLRDLGQVFLLTPVFPLIGAVLGYIFGTQQKPGGSGDGR